jgi:hypothetical protein
VRGHLGGYGFGDADHDGDVDLDDLNAVRNQFGDAPVSVAGGTEAPRRLKEAAGVAWSRAVDLLFAVDRTHADSAQSGSYWLLKPASHSSSSNGLRFSGPSRLGRT